MSQLRFTMNKKETMDIFLHHYMRQTICTVGSLSIMECTYSKVRQPKEQ